MRTILITGAGGFLGRHAAKYFSGQGWRVTGLGRTSPVSSNLTEWGISDWVTSDLASQHSLSLQSKPDAVVHCAGSSDVRRSEDAPNEDFRDSVLSLQATLEFCRSLDKGCRFIYLSSAAVYGSARRLPIHETDDAAPISVYGVNKSICEQLVQAYAGHFGLRASIIRFFSIYGPDLRKQIFWDSSRKALAGDYKFFGTGLETRDFLHVEDAVRLIEFALQDSSDECSVVNGGSGEATTIRILVSSIFKALGISVEPEFSQDKRIGDPKDYVADTTKATGWGWQPTRSIEDGIVEYIDWVRSLPTSEILDN